jgi:hypothetical protein
MRELILCYDLKYLLWDIIFESRGNTMVFCMVGALIKTTVPLEGFFDVEGDKKGVDNSPSI